VATEELQKMIDSFLDVSVQSFNSSNLKEAFFEMEIKLAEMDEEWKNLMHQLPKKDIYDALPALLRFYYQRNIEIDEV
jgi:hypothetical protein